MNRTSKPVTGVWDGKPNVIPAGGRVALPLVVAEAIKRQNVVMGSEDPYSGEMQYLVGVVEHNDDLSPIEQTRSITRMNRRGIEKPDEVVVEGRTGLYSTRDLAPPPGIGTGGANAGVVSTFSKK